MSPPAASPIEDLRYTREVLSRRNDPAAARMVRRLDAYLDLASDITADQAFEVSSAPGREHWRTIDNRRTRDQEFCALAQQFLSAEKTVKQADAVSALIDRYRIQWKTDRHAPAMPAEYQGTPRANLYRAFRAFERMPSKAHLRRILRMS
jgi:hypothetical protein